MSKREQWRAKAAQYLVWHREARRFALSDWERGGAWLRMYREARHCADYWEKYGEHARAPTGYYPNWGNSPERAGVAAA